MAVDLVTYRRAAKPATVLIFIPFWQHKEEGFDYWYCFPAFWAVELSRLKFIEARLLLSFTLGRGVSEWSCHIHNKFPFLFGYDIRL